MNAIPHILVAGATGKVGGAVVRELARRGDLNVIAGVRSLEPARDLAAEGVAQRRLDLDDAASLAPALEGVDRALLLTGYSVDMLRQSKRFLDAAREAGVAHIVHIGASGAATNEVAHWGWHQFVESYVEAKGFAWTHLQPEAFMQNLAAFDWLQEGSLTSFIGEARWSWVDCDDVAAVAAAVLAEPERHAGRTYRLGVEAGSMAEVAAILSAELGQPVGVENRAPEGFYDAAVAGGGDPAYLACILNQFRLNAAGAIPQADAIFDTVQTITRRPPTSWAEHVRRHAAVLRPLATAAPRPRA